MMTKKQQGLLQYANRTVHRACDRGTRRRGMKYPDGSYDNDYLMIKMIK